MVKAKEPKTPKEPKVRKVKGAKLAPSPAAGSNTMDPDLRALFLKNKDDYAKAMQKLGTAQSAVRALGKVIKSDGFTIRQIKLAIQLESPEGEAEFRAMVASDLLAAQYAGSPVGSQLSLFLEPDRTPAVDRAYQEGVRDCIEGKAARSPYDPSLPQSQSYLTGFADEQERRLKAGITKLEPAKGYIPMTAAELANQQAEAVKAGAGPRTAEMAAKRAAVVTDKPAGNA